MSSDPASSDAGIVRQLIEGFGLWFFSAVGIYVMYDMWQRRGLANNTEWVVVFYGLLTLLLLGTAAVRTRDHLGLNAPSA